MIRFKVVIAVLLLAVGLLGLAIFFNHLAPTTPSANPDRSASPASNTAPSLEYRVAHSAAPATARADTSLAIAHSSTADSQAQETYIARRIDELNTLATRNDTASRDAIVSELRNPNREIRKAAVEAAIQFGDRSVVPSLQQAAEQTEDTGEKAEILAAVDYIQLPSLTEYLAQQKAAGSTNLLLGSTNTIRRPRGASDRPRHAE